MNVFSDDLFCEAFKIAYFPNEEVKPTLFEVQGQLWRLPAINATKAVVKNSFTSLFIDFYEPVDPQSNFTQSEIEKIDWIPKVCHGLASKNEWFDRKLNRIYDPAPTILWNNFNSWNEFVHYVRTNRSNIFVDSRRRCRRLEKEIGPLTFIFDDPRPETKETCMQWKSDQYCKELFSYEQHVRLFQELARNKLLLVSSLSAGDRLVAAHLGMFCSGRIYWWVPSYDTSYSEYSPGRLLLEFLLEESFNRNHGEFDFLHGNESYKWNYATHARLIADIGSRPLSMQVKQFMESQKRSILTRFSGLKRRVKEYMLYSEKHKNKV